MLSPGCGTSKTVVANLQSPDPEASDNNPRQTDYSDPSTLILGYINKEKLLAEPHSEWYTKGYEDYSFSSVAINSLLDISKEEISIKIVMGTWCPDSRREVPRFMKIIDLWQFPAQLITIIGVDRTKLSQINDYAKLDIEKVPTFIIYKNNIEAGRIIEIPVTSLEQDLVNILKKE